MNTIFAWAPGGMQVILILAIVLILFGAKKIPELAKGLGHGIKEFKKATKEVTDEIQNTPTETTPAKPTMVASQSQPTSTVSQNSTPPKA